jgi:LmbE family N-acetylglucosaminyl deacetylase
MIGLVCVGGAASPVQGATDPCAEGGTLYVVAHPDDDLLFLSPDLLHDVRDGRCVRTVFVTAGDSGDGMGYGSIRERGIAAAYAQMAGTANTWRVGDAGLVGHPSTLLTLQDRPTVSLVFLRLPNANSEGADLGYASHNFETLQKLWKGLIPQIATVDGASVYTRSELTTGLTTLMNAFQPATIRTQDYIGSFGDGDHPDHHAAAYFARAAHTAYTRSHVLVGYLDYGSSALAQNVFDPDLTAKQQAFEAYAGHDLVCGSPPMCTGTIYGNWILRQYTVGSEVGGGNAAPTVSGFSLAAGPVGSTVAITGTGLTFANAVRFNGLSATFTVNSATQIMATVPAGATTGPISVTTPAGTATSATPYTVLSTSSTRYRSTVLSDAPAGYWRLGEATGVVATDETGHGWNASYLAAPSQGQAGAILGDINGSVGLDGVNQYVEVPYGGALDPSVFTVEAWAFPTGGSGRFRSVVTSRDTSNGIALYAGDANTWQFWLRTNGVDTKLHGPPVTLDAWTHLAATYDGAAARLYVNGNLVASASVAYSPNTTRPLRIGAGKTETVPAYYFPGRVDDVALYSRALTGTAIRVHYDEAQTAQADGPSISGFSPGSGTVGSSVTISGSNLGGATAVHFNGLSASFTSISASQLTATVPAGATTGPITVTTPNGTASSKKDFKVLAKRAANAILQLST